MHSLVFDIKIQYCSKRSPNFVVMNYMYVKFSYCMIYTPQYLLILSSPTLYSERINVF